MRKKEPKEPKEPKKPQKPQQLPEFPQFNDLCPELRYLILSKSDNSTLRAFKRTYKKAEDDNRSFFQNIFFLKLFAELLYLFHKIHRISNLEKLDLLYSAVDHYFTKITNRIEKAYPSRLLTGFTSIMPNFLNEFNNRVPTLNWYKKNYNRILEFYEVFYESNYPQLSIIAPDPLKDLKRYLTQREADYIASAKYTPSYLGAIMTGSVVMTLLVGMLALITVLILTISNPFTLIPILICLTCFAPLGISKIVSEHLSMNAIRNIKAGKHRLDMYLDLMEQQQKMLALSQFSEGDKGEVNLKRLEAFKKAKSLEVQRKKIINLLLTQFKETNSAGIKKILSEINECNSQITAHRLFELITKQCTERKDRRLSKISFFGSGRSQKAQNLYNFDQGFDTSDSREKFIRLLKNIPNAS